MRSDRAEGNARNRAYRGIDTISPLHPSNPSWRTLIVLIVGVVSVVVITYWPVLSAGATSFDDDEYLADASPIRSPSWGSAQRIFGEILRPSAMYGYYHPLTLTSLMLDVATGAAGDNLRPFHRTNLALHVLNTVLIVVFLYLLFRQPWVAATLGVLFGVHPLTVEPVAWVAERKTLLATALALWCLVSYVAYARRKSRTLYGMCMATYVLALLAKPTTTPLPALMLLLDFWPLRRLCWRAVTEKVPFLVIAGVSAAVTMVSTSRTGGIGLPDAHAVLDLPLRTSYLMAFYLGKIVWPADLSSVYSLPEPLALSNPVVLLGAVGTCVFVGALLVTLRWTPAIFVGWLCFFIALAPTLGLVEYSWVAASDKYVYLPAIGLLIPLACYARRLWDSSTSPSRSMRRRVGLCTAVAILTVVYAVGTRGYLAYWRDTETLYRRAVRLAPRSPWPRANLAAALAEKGRTEEAIALFEQAVRLPPPWAQVRVNLALALVQSGRFDEALEHLGAALRIDPGSPAAHQTLANILFTKGQIDEAIAHCLAALRANPNFAEAHQTLGIAMASKGKLDEGLRELREAVRLSPRLANARCALGDVLVAQGRSNEGMAQYREVLRIEPTHVIARARLRGALTGRSQSGK